MIQNKLDSLSWVVMNIYYHIKYNYIMYYYIIIIVLLVLLFIIIKIIFQRIIQKKANKTSDNSYNNSTELNDITNNQSNETIIYHHEDESNETKEEHRKLRKLKIWVFVVFVTFMISLIIFQDNVSDIIAFMKKNPYLQYFPIIMLILVILLKSGRILYYTLKAAKERYGTYKYIIIVSSLFFVCIVIYSLYRYYDLKYLYDYGMENSFTATDIFIHIFDSTISIYDILSLFLENRHVLCS